MKLSPIFSNHMVLQRNKPIRIWGEGNGEITVTLNNQTQTATSEDGKWTVTLSPEAAGGPFELTVCAQKEKIVLSDVMIGDVWLAAGQSNMECVTFLASDGISDAQKFGNNKNIRYFTVPRRTKEGEEVYRWHFESVLSSDKEWEVSTENTALHFSAIGFWFANLLQKEENIPVGIISCNFGGTRIESWIDYDLIQTEAALDYAKKEYTDILNNLEFNSYINERENQLSNVKEFCGKFNALEMSKQMGIKQFAVNPGLPWPAPPPMGPYCENFGGVLFENMIKRITPIGIAGVLWYQGESNAGTAEHYSKAFSVMVKNWRAAFQDKLQFLTVQIAPYSRYAAEDARAVLNREQLLATYENDKVAIVTTGDVGEADNIHPLNKKTVAQRLFAAAQSTVYGKGNEYCGPVAHTAVLRKDGKIAIDFEHANQGLRPNSNVNNVYVSDEQGNFAPANAYTKEKLLIIDCAGIAKPKAVKMGWQNYAHIDLYNAEGFPAMPFYFEL